ncbi:protein toll [Caerostris darwini]|uniref:Protein toll n=1 Tax=Caerostris darwini TaxID=1538125 RepID=A0AAV4SHP0_9ARAC|nr:protein toll [Caerostris darwini]
MDYYQSIYVLFFLVLSSTALETESCSIKENSKSKDHCFCDPLDGSLSGWTYTCIDSVRFESLYSVKYVADRSITFQCGEHEPIYKSILNQVELGEIQTFAFKSCSLPNSSFSEIVPNRERYPVEQIIIEAKKDRTLFTAELFGNISQSLKSLILSGNNIDSLPESLFRNFTLLKYLSLSDNKLRTLPESIFQNVTNLVILEITNNAVESLPSNVFQNLSLLEKLYLYKNKLRGLPDGIFKSLVNLKVLDLADNNLMSLPDDVFAGLSNLIHIRLRANWLMTLSKDLFRSSPNLKDIDLSLNRFMEPLAEDLFLGLTQLENVIIPNCNLTEIHENLFAYSPNISTLILERNSLTSLPKNIFVNNSMLKEINLNFNHLNYLPPNLFPNQMNLEKLSIFKNNLSFIPHSLFQKARNIKNLVLGGNQIQNASQEIFRDLPNLEILDLSVNKLTYFRLDSNQHVKQIDLSYNNLTEMPYIQWSRHLKLERLNLEHNKISYLSIPILVLFSSNKRNTILNFAHNNIKTVNAEHVALNDRLINDNLSKDYDSIIETRIILNSNPFVCDCKIYNFYDYIRQSHKFPKRSVRLDMVNNLTCKEPQHLVGKSIMLLSPDQFTCELREQCPHPCHCYNRAEDNANIVNCSYHRLDTLPSVVPNNTKVLLFQENMLSNMSGFDEDIWKNLTEIFLDKNQITDLDDWKVPSNLKNISLNGNNIKHLPSSFMNFISNAPQFEITLRDNPFNCNCSAIGFKKWLTEHYQVVKDVKQIMCANRLKWNGTLTRTPILITPDDVLCPLDDWPYKLHLISVTVICIVLALLLFIVSVLYYRNKQTVIAYVYIHMHHVFTCFFNEEEIDEDKIFDAFVSYSNSDRDIALSLIEELERKDPGFNLCIHERNWIAGHPISWNIFNSVHNSKRTILIISKEFLKSMWFQVEFHTAYYQMLEDKIDRLIIIVKGELPPKDTLDSDLQYLLSTKTYLIWEEKWFWEKLKYAMPHKKQLLPNDVLALKDRPALEKIKVVDNQIAILSSVQKNGKCQEAIQNHTNSTMNLIKKDSSNKK